MRISRAPVAQTGGLTDVYLKSDPGQGFLPTDRIVSDAGNYRTVGPVLAAASGDRIFKRVRIPLRATATGAGSASLGKTLTLTIINVTNTQNQVVLRRASLPIVQDMTEAVFEGPFTIPAGQSHAYVYGIDEDGWSTHLGLFYGTGNPYAAPNAGVNVLFSDTVTPGVGQGYSGSIGARSRAIACEADGTVKNVHGPLDASDFPVVTSVDQLLAGQAALLDNGTDPPRLVRRRLDGSTPAFVNAVSEWPVFVGFMETSDAPNTPPTQVITGPGFQRLNVLAQDDPHGDFNNGTHAWTCPQTGTYHIEMKLRLMDGTPPGIGFGYGADLFERDSPSFLWVNTQASRQGAPPNQRLMRLTAGQQVVMFLYWDGASPNDSANVKSAEITIVRIR